MLINNKKGWSLDLLVTLKKPVAKYTRKIDFYEDVSHLHLVHSELKKSQEEIQTAEIIVVSMDPYSLFYGPYSIGTWNIQIDHDLSDLVHIRGYCDFILKLRERKDITLAKKNKYWLAVDRTVFVNSLDVDSYRNVMNHLNFIRDLRIVERTEIPRKNREQKFSFDNRDKALARMINRMNAIMNSLMYWGKTEGDFSQEIAVNPERPYQI